MGTLVAILIFLLTAREESESQRSVTGIDPRQTIVLTLLMESKASALMTRRLAEEAIVTVTLKSLR